MFGFRRKEAARVAAIEGLHRAVIAASRAPELYGPGGFADTLEGRFESLVLHVRLVLVRLRSLPPPAEEISQELINAVFADLEVAMRESGVGDFGVPKRMKKLGRAFYDRLSRYDAAYEAGPGAIRAEIATRVDGPSDRLGLIEPYLERARDVLDRCDLEAILAGPPFRDALSPTTVA